MLLRILLVLSLCAFCTLPAHAGDLEEGRAAIGAGDYATALRLLKPLAEQGDPDAQNALGVLYAQGWGVERDYGEALQWFQKAVDQGHAKAQANLGDVYAYGKGVAQDYAKAARLYRLSAEQGYVTAQVRLGGLYDEGLGVPRDYAKAARWYRMAAEQGNAVAQGLLGAMYARGDGVEQDYAVAMRWYRKSAEQGLPESQYNLGHMYEHGEGVVPDEAEAMKWFRMAAEQEHPGAIARLNALAGTAELGASREPTLNQALAAPAINLAKGFLWVKLMTKKIRIAEMGATIHIDGETINKSNAKEYRQRYEKRLSNYTAAITQRGYKIISGDYSGKTTESCKRIKSSWVGDHADIKITQDGFEASLVVGNIDNKSIIVESSIVIQDAMNSDYYFHGVIKDKEIVIKPDVSVLNTWPEWAAPPSRHDLEKCTITLRKKSVDSGE